MKCCECNIKLCKASKYAGTTQDCTETPIPFVYTICVNPHRASSVSGCVKLDPLEYIVFIVTLGNGSETDFQVSQYIPKVMVTLPLSVFIPLCVLENGGVSECYTLLCFLCGRLSHGGRGVFKFEGWYKVSQCPYKIELSISRPKDRVFSTFFHRLIYDHIAAQDTKKTFRMRWD